MVVEVNKGKERKDVKKIKADFINCVDKETLHALQVKCERALYE